MSETKLRLPKLTPTVESPIPGRFIAITIDRSGTVMVEGKVGSVKERLSLGEANLNYAAHARNRALLIVDRQCEMKHVQKIMRELRSISIHRVRFLTR